MSRVAELWNGLEDNEKTLLFAAAKHYLADRGAELVVAIAQHAEAHTETAAPPLICPDCTQPIRGEPIARLVDVNGSKRPVWLCVGCNSDRLLHRTPTREGT